MSATGPTERNRRDREPKSLRGAGRGWIADLFALAAMTVLTAGLLWTQALPQYIVWIIAVPFIVFYPGYALMAALFPEKAPQLHTSEVEPKQAPTRLSRVALAIVLSPVLLGILAILLSPWNAVALGPLLIGITAITLGGLVIAAVRRLALPPHVREGITVAEAKSWLQLTVPTGSRQNISLVLAIVLLVGVSTVAMTMPMDGEAYTEAYLLSETDGEYLATNLPDDVDAGDTEVFHVGIENHENEEVTYEMVAVFQELDGGGEVSAQQELNASTVTLGDEEQAIEEQSFTVPTVEGEHRLQVLIYEGEMAEDPTDDNADHVLQLQLTVSDGEG